MKAGKKYLLIFIAIAIAVFLFTQYPSLNIENFESEGISWWVWLLIALLGIPIVLLVIQMITYNNQKEEFWETSRKMNDNMAAWNSKERARRANHQAYMAEIDKQMEAKKAREAQGGARNRQNKRRTKSKRRSAK
jgi:biopolymer transport protein ExbB/TolQ